jgi:hypothetical protein
MISSIRSLMSGPASIKANPLTVILTMALMLWMVPASAASKDRYWSLVCKSGTVLEKADDSAEFRCRRLYEYQTGRCKRPSKLRGTTRYAQTFGCAGTTIATKGDSGTWESWSEFACPAGFEARRHAKDIKLTCRKPLAKIRYEKPKLE